MTKREREQRQLIAHHGLEVLSVNKRHHHQYLLRHPVTRRTAKVVFSKSPSDYREPKQAAQVLRAVAKRLSH